MHTRETRSIVSVLSGRNDVRIIWVTGMKIHNEVAGIYGAMWRGYIAMYPATLKWLI